MSFLLLASALIGSMQINPAWPDPTATRTVLIRDEEIVSVVAKGAEGKDLFQAGAMSRVPALIALMQLVDERRIDLEKPLTNYLKGFKVPTGSVKLVRPLLVKDLLTGQAGFELYKFAGLPIGSTMPSMGEILSSYSMTFAPGEKVARSGVNELYVQKLLQDVEGKPYPEIIQRRVFGPLKLTGSGFDGMLSPQLQARIVPGEKPLLRYPQLAAQGLWTTATDLATMLCAIMKSARGESKLLKPESASKMFTEVRDQATYGLNRNPINGGFQVYLGGQTSGYSGSFQLIPEDGTGVVILTNADMGWSTISKTINEGFSAVSMMKPGNSAASFEPYHVSGEYKGQEICPVCEFPLLPITFFWVQSDSDENILKAAKILQAQIDSVGPAKQKGFIVFSNLDGQLEANKYRATVLAEKAGTPNVSFVVVKDPRAATLRSYRIPRNSVNVVYVVNARSVKSVFRDLTVDEAGSKALATAMAAARG